MALRRRGPIPSRNRHLTVQKVSVLIWWPHAAAEPPARLLHGHVLYLPTLFRADHEPLT
ncbi:hypothetical protein CCHR01_02035 [Colletotrichum chrysophilum]|uniref:Uncharacterized protein n=1 Tax=Colletotrichum chrysophilum TaxID=1836956 RepID=A0AAD9EPU9_9PEZI|nr:hypothetical protein CCHR01_02035 [Colletotrichum chrysophilum]